MTATTEALVKARKACHREDCELADQCRIHVRQMGERVRPWRSEHTGQECDHYRPVEEMAHG